MLSFPCATNAKEKDSHLDLGSWVGLSNGQIVTAKILRVASAADLASVFFNLRGKCNDIDWVIEVNYWEDECSGSLILSPLWHTQWKMLGPRWIPMGKCILKASKTPISDRSLYLGFSFPVSSVQHSIQRIPFRRSCPLSLNGKLAQQWDILHEYTCYKLSDIYQYNST